MEIRRHSEVRCDDIPMGYELSRSLTRRLKNDDFLVRKSTSAIDSDFLLPKLQETVIWDDHHEPPRHSVVARLMGLEPLPWQNAVRTTLHCQSELYSRRSVTPQESFRSDIQPSVPRDASFSVSAVQSHQAIPSVAEFILDRRPAMRTSQEHFQRTKDIQDKAQELAMYGRKILRDAATEGRKQRLQQESLRESQEFLDALDFLRSNKDFFAKVLKDPSSLFGTRLQGREIGRETSTNDKGSRLSSSVSKMGMQKHIDAGAEFIGCRNEPHSRASQVDDGSAECRAMNRMNCLDSIETKTWETDASPAQRSQMSSPVKGLGREGNQVQRTKIVVLRPKEARHAKDGSPLSSLVDSDTITSMIEKVRNGITKQRGTNKNKGVEVSSAYRNNSNGRRDKRLHASPQAREDTKKTSMQATSQEVEPCFQLNTNRKDKCSKRNQGSTAQLDTSASDSEEYSQSSGRRIGPSISKSNYGVNSSQRPSRIGSGINARLYGRKVCNADPGQKGVCRLTSDFPPTSYTNPVGRGSVGERCRSPVLPRKRDGISDSEHLYDTNKRLGTNLNEMTATAKASQRSSSASASKACKVIDRSSKGSIHENNLASGSGRTRTPQRPPHSDKLPSLKDGPSMVDVSSSNKRSKDNPRSPLRCSRRQNDSYALVAGKNKTISSSSQFSCRVRSPNSSQDLEDIRVILRCDGDGAPMDTKASVDGSHQWSASSDHLDSSSDMSSEKCEQPSPVSVLPTTFLHVHTTPEKSANDESIRFNHFETDQVKQLFGNEGALDTTFQCHWCDPVAVQTTKHVATIHDTLTVSGIPCACETEAELSYARDVLAFSGFTDREVVKDFTFSNEHGLNPSLFEKMEDYYSVALEVKNRHAPLSPVQRRLLFDVIDEILLIRLAESGVESKLLHQNRLVPQAPCTGKQLLEHIWLILNDKGDVPRDFSEEESLDALALKDITEDTSWMQTQLEVQAIALEIEKLICSDLIWETAHEIKRKLDLSLQSLSGNEIGSTFRQLHPFL
ncbi:hypothetical protein KP509_01G024800 [Ceratopteris richardii]|nr:hypothetical protein KP509_01G024800 [Ceratopteris richardii]